MSSDSPSGKPNVPQHLSRVSFGFSKLQRRHHRDLETASLIGSAFKISGRTVFNELFAKRYYGRHGLRAAVWIMRGFRKGYDKAGHKVRFGPLLYGVCPSCRWVTFLPGKAGHGYRRNFRGTL